MATETEEIDPKLKKKIDEGSELDQYFIINEIGGFRWRMEHELCHGRISDGDWPSISKDIARLTIAQQYAVSLLTRFGVSKPFRDDKIKPSAEYWSWFRWWDSYIKGLPQDEWKEIERRCGAKEDLSIYRPQGEWRTRIPEEEDSIRRAEEFWSKINKPVVA